MQWSNDRYNSTNAIQQSTTRTALQQVMIRQIIKKQAFRYILPVLRPSLVFLLVLVILKPGLSTAEDTDMKIGVLAFRGSQAAYDMWAPTANYLSTNIPGYSFSIVPLDLQGMHRAARERSIDFVFTNSGNYVDLEASYGTSRLATLRNLRQGKPYTVFGAVIISLAERNDIRTLRDLKGKSFMAVGKHAFGGFQMAWRELKEQGVDPFSDLSRVEFTGFPQDEIVYAVRDAKVDAGTVRSDTLARMAQEGLVELSIFRVLNEHSSPGYPFLLSTRIYPEWPFARLNHISETLGQQVAITLLTLPPESPTAVSGKSAGWTIPLDYGPVHDLLRSLKIGPYKAIGEVTLAKVLTRYWHWLLAGLVILVMMGLVTAYVLRINRRLELSQQGLQGEIAERKTAQNQLALHRDTLEQQVQERTQELREDIQARQQVEETLRRSESTLRRLNEITTSTVFEFEDKLRELLELGTEHFELPTGVFSQIHEKSYEIIEVVSPDKRFTKGALMPLEDTFCQIVLSSQEVIAFKDIGQSAYRDLPVVQHMGLRAYFGAIVQVAGKVYGTLCFFSMDRREAPFSPVDKDILQLVAQWIGEEVDRQNTQDQARRHQDALAHVSKLGSMGQMASALAHELNQPLTALVNYTQGCIRRLQTDSENVEGLIGAMKQAAAEAERAAEIVRGLREFVEKDESHRTLISINAAIHDVVKIAEVEARQQGVTLKLNLADNLSEVAADMIQLQQVILNLVRNGLEAVADESLKERRLYISTTCLGDETIEVVIRDTGCGLPEVPVEDVFYPFFTTKQGGMGMGLSISRSIIEAHGGRLHAEPARGGGSIFLFTLPIFSEKLEYGS